MLYADSSLARDYARSLARSASDRKCVSDSLDAKQVSDRLHDLTRPSSLKHTMRKVGIALALAPEPVTTMVGIGLVGTSFAMMGGEPASLATLANEATEQFSSLAQFSLNLSSMTI